LYNRIQDTTTSSSLSSQPQKKSQNTEPPVKVARTALQQSVATVPESAKKWENISSIKMGDLGPPSSELPVNVAQKSNFIATPIKYPMGEKLMEIAKRKKN